MTTARVPVRREPPPFRQVAVRRVEAVSPRLARVTLAGDELDGFLVDAPAASVRLLLPSSGTPEFVVPLWHGNEFLLPDGRRPTIRTLTPWHVDSARREMEVGIVLHGTGAASEWAAGATEGARAAVSGPGRGYSVATDAAVYFVAGDETAIPAIDQLLGAIPASVDVAVHIEIADPSARSRVDRASVGFDHVARGPGRRACRAAALAAAVLAADIDAAAHVWVAGEAAAVQRVRRHLQERGLPRTGDGAGLLEARPRRRDRRRRLTQTNPRIGGSCSASTPVATANS